MDMTGQWYFNVFHTTAGWCGIAGSSAGVRLVVLPRPDKCEVELKILAAFNRAVPATDTYKDLAGRLVAYFDGRTVDFPDLLDLSGATDFQKKVWQAAQWIPRGQTRSYGWLAGQIGRPQAARAVGQALGKNPLPVIVPCHRVLAADGGLGGFSGGLDMKKFLLGLESKTGVSGAETTVFDKAGD